MYTPLFIPPRDNLIFVRATTALLPTLAQIFGGIKDVRVLDGDFENLRGIGPGRALITSNHPTGNDPIVLMWLSRMLGQPFNYLAAREIFVGAKGWCLNQAGAYSVIRGFSDRESLRTTRRLLAEMDRKVVIFPEGEIYEHNDALLTFQSGVPQIGYWVLDDLARMGRPPAMPVVPVAVKYLCADSPRPAIENALSALEHELDLPRDRRLGDYGRLLRVGERMLAFVERDIGLNPAPKEPLQQRIDAYRRALVERVSRLIQQPVDPQMQPADQLHRLYNALRAWVGEQKEGLSPYEETLFRRRVEFAEPHFRDLLRLQNFIAITADYVIRKPSAERFLDVLGRLQKEAFGEERYRLQRIALVRIAPPIPLEERYDEYRQQRRAVVAEVTRTLQETIRQMVMDLGRHSTPLELDEPPSRPVGPGDEPEDEATDGE